MFAETRSRGQAEFDRSEPTIEIRVGGGKFIGIGLVLLSGGIALLWLGFNADKLADPKAAVPCFLFGGIITALGIVALLGRKATNINRFRREITQWWGLAGPWKSKTLPIDSYNEVQLSYERSGSGKNSSSYYPVRLSGDPDVQLLTICHKKSYNPARVQAEQIAIYLGIPLRDKSQGEDILRPAESLNETVQSRLTKQNPSIEWPGDSQPSRIRFDSNNALCKIDLPKVGMIPLYWVLLALFLASTVPTFGILFVIARSSESMATVAGIFLGVATLCEVLFIVWLANARDQITIGYHSLSIKRRFPIGWYRWKFNYTELEELQIVEPRTVKNAPLAGFHSSKLLFRSDVSSCSCGKHLTESELQWLEHAIGYLVVNPPQDQ